MTDNQKPSAKNKSGQKKSDNKKSGAPRGLVTVLVIGGIIVVALLLVFLIYSSEPTAQREGATKQTAMLVDVEEMQRGTYIPLIEGLGAVEAAQDIILSPRVDGRIMEISERFIPGGFVDEGESLVKIDPADYQNQARQRESALQNAQSLLEIEKGRRDVAQQEYALLDQKISDENKALVLREPQLAAAEADVVSATAALEQARLELDRTAIKAPFNAQILARNVNKGSQVDPSTDLARLIGVDEYWVIVSVPVSKLERIALPKGGETGAQVTLRHRAAWPKGATRQGHVMRLIGALDNDTRLARLVVSVRDPLALNKDTSGPPLLVGSILQARIDGRKLEKVFRINRDYLREGDRLWLKRHGKLVISEADVAFRDKDYAYISAGMENGDLLVTSNLATVAEGIGLRTENMNTDESSGESAGASE